MATREHIVTNYPQIYSHNPGSISYEPLGTPPQTYPARRPSWIIYELIKIIVGPYSRGAVIVPASGSATGDAVVLMGITAPTTAPVLASAGGGTLTGDMIGYFSYVHKNAGVDIHESDLSPGSNTLTLTGSEQRLWTWDETGVEARVTHARLYVSVDGATPKFVADFAIGIATATEDTATGALGDTPPVDEDGNLLNERGVPPYSKFVVKFHDRAWYGPDTTYPYRFYYSMIGEPESVGPLNFFDLRDRETITSMGEVGNELGLWGAHCLYALVGYDESDFQLVKISDNVGCLSHFANIQINEKRWFPAQLGVFSYSGGGVLQYMMGHDLRQRWKDDYQTNPGAFENSIAINDKEELLYLLVLNYTESPRSRYWVGSYTDIDPAMGGSGPMRWSFDLEARQVTTLGFLYDTGTLRESVYSGSCDSYYRKRNDYDNDDDDGDTYQKQMEFETAHFMPQHDKGIAISGNVLTAVIFYLKSELKAWTLEVRSGEDNAYLASRASWSLRTRASAETQAGRARVPKMAHQVQPNVTGEGWIIRVLIPKAKQIVYSGLELMWTDGIGARSRR